jgi:hypothetical protein
MTCLVADRAGRVDVLVTLNGLRLAQGRDVMPQSSVLTDLPATEVPDCLGTSRSLVLRVTSIAK